MDILKNLLNYAKKSEPAPEVMLDNTFELVREYMVVGNEYECELNKRKKRHDIIKQSSVGDYVDIKPFYYKKQRAYLVVSRKLKLDLGTLSHTAATTLSKNPNAIYFGILSQKEKDSYLVNVYKKDK